MSGETPKRGIGAYTDDPAVVDSSATPTVGDASVIALLKRLIILTATPGSSGGGLTDAELRATPVPVSGPLTDAELRAAAVPVSGPLTDAQLRLTPYLIDLRPAVISQTVTGAPNAIATATLPAAGAGIYHYITHIFIKRVATAVLAGGAILTVTTTNLGGRAWRTGNQMSITVATQEGTVLIDKEFVHPIRSAGANTITTIVGPAPGAAVSWHMVIDYYTGPLLIP